MIYDCFIFFNELDILELRFNELDKYVDKFVLVESTNTFTGKQKPLHFNINIKRFEKFFHKIIYVVVDDLKPDDCLTYYGGDIIYWRRESYLRNSISRGLMGCKPDDIILISDIDEIPKLDIIDKLQTAGFNFYCPLVFKQKFYCYYLNMYQHNIWKGTTVCSYSFFQKVLNSKPQKLRDMRWDVACFQNGGWHFSYQGGVDKVLYKIQEGSHQELVNNNICDRKYLESCIENKKFFVTEKSLSNVPLDSSFPKYLVENKDRFAHMIKSI